MCLLRGRALAYVKATSPAEWLRVMRGEAAADQRELVLLGEGVTLNSEGGGGSRRVCRVRGGAGAAWQGSWSGAEGVRGPTPLPYKIQEAWWVRNQSIERKAGGRAC